MTIMELRDMIQDGVDKDDSCLKIADAILSRYRPSPQADIVGELKEKCEEARGLNPEYGPAAPIALTVYELEEIIRKHEGSK